MEKKPNPYYRILNKAIEKCIPLIMQFELTSRCNLNCIHCYNVNKNKNELSCKKIKSILDELAEEGVLFIGFTGGEIFLRKDFFEIVKYARKKGFALRLFTNATLIDDKIADKLQDIQPLTVEISLYAMSPNIHDKITQTFGSYDKTMYAIKMLKERKINLVIKSVIMDENAQEHGRLKAFADDIDARFVYDYTIIPKTDGSKKPLSHCMNDISLKDFICKNANMDTISKDRLCKLKQLPAKDEIICGAARDGVCISSCGDVYPCVTWRVSLGNLKEKDFKEIWNSPLANRIRSLTIGDLRYCADCRLFSFCNLCPGMALLETGDSLGLSPTACRSAKLRKQALDKMICKLQIA